MLDVLTIWKREYGPGAMTPVQEEVIRHIMRGRDALVVMPRGEDRELCFQVPALLMRGWKVVVSPRLRERREGRTLYVRPERLPRALAWLRGREVGLFVVDEAQCMEPWREDYRRAYDGLGEVRRHYPWVPFVAFTGARDQWTKDYVFTQLWLRGWACFEVPEASQDVPVPAEASPENYLVRQKRLHRNAYAKWRPEDDRLLLETYRSGASVRDLAALFSRNEGAIRSRLKKKGIL